LQQVWRFGPGGVGALPLGSQTRIGARPYRHIKSWSSLLLTRQTFDKILVGHF
jgi:hypothetical protein